MEIQIIPNLPDQLCGVIVRPTNTVSDILETIIIMWKICNVQMRLMTKMAHRTLSSLTHNKMLRFSLTIAELVSIASLCIFKTEKIASLQSEVERYQPEIASLQSQVASLQDQVVNLQSEITSLRPKISDVEKNQSLVHDNEMNDMGNPYQCGSYDACSDNPLFSILILVLSLVGLMQKIASVNRKIEKLGQTQDEYHQSMLSICLSAS